MFWLLTYFSQIQAMVEKNKALFVALTATLFLCFISIFSFHSNSQNFLNLSMSNAHRALSSIPHLDISPGQIFTREYQLSRLRIEDFSAKKSSWRKSLLDEDSLLEPSYLERLYQERPYAKGNGDSSQAYFDRTLRFENEYDNPFRFENEQDYERIRTSRKRIFDDWRKQEVNEHSQDIVRGADPDSFPIRILKKTKSFFGGSDLFRKEDTKTGETKTAAKQEAPPARIFLKETPKEKKQEPAIEAKVRSKMNVAKKYGRVEMESNIINTAARLDLRNQEQVEFQAKKEIKLLAIDSGISYGIKNKTTSMNVNKKITDQIDCELRSLKSQNKEIINEESVRLNYHISF